MKIKSLLFTAFAALFFTTTLFSQIPNYVPTNGLVGWWPFNGNANDESGNGNNGTVNGATLTSDRFGMTNEAFGFSGDNEVINCGNSSTLGLTSNSTLTLCYWTQSTDNKWPFIHKYEDNIAANSNFAVGNQNQQIVVTGNGQNNWIFPISSATSWTFICFVYDGSVDSVSFYLNGILIDVKPIMLSSNISTSNLIFGPRFNTAGYPQPNGKLDDIAIWNRALNQCEISDLYNSQLGSLNSTSTQTETALDSYTWPVNGQTYTQSGQYIDTLINAAGCDSVITLDLTLSFTGIESLQLNPNKKLVKIIDLNGKETPLRKNTVLLFIYEDGTVERAYVTE